MEGFSRKLGAPEVVSPRQGPGEMSVSSACLWESEQNIPFHIQCDSDKLKRAYKGKLIPLAYMNEMGWPNSQIRCQLAKPRAVQLQLPSHLVVLPHYGNLILSQSTENRLNHLTEIINCCQRRRRIDSESLLTWFRNCRRLCPIPHWPIADAICTVNWVESS